MSAILNRLRASIVPTLTVVGLSVLSGTVCAAAPPPDLQSQARKRISVMDAAKHVGETMWVCGDVVSTRYDRTEIGMPTFLMFGQGYPSTPPAFTVVIWDKDRGYFPWAPEERYHGQNVCVGGTITKDKLGVPEMFATSPKQIEEQKKKP
ncbi:MAG TPA: hypothetical protein VND92_03065 [Vicinamibacterales bacterium]|nr:hypothetical protein [Vicinamibacterales bacterium]